MPGQGHSPPFTLKQRGWLEQVLSEQYLTSMDPWALLCAAARYSVTRLEGSCQINSCKENSPSSFCNCLRNILGNFCVIEPLSVPVWENTFSNSVPLLPVDQATEWTCLGLALQIRPCNENPSAWKVVISREHSSEMNVSNQKSKQNDRSKEKKWISPSLHRDWDSSSFSILVTFPCKYLINVRGS